jgi:hypothetical protein
MLSSPFRRNPVRVKRPPARPATTGRTAASWIHRPIEGSTPGICRKCNLPMSSVTNLRHMPPQYPTGETPDYALLASGDIKPQRERPNPNVWW